MSQYTSAMGSRPWPQCLSLSTVLSLSLSHTHTHTLLGSAKYQRNSERCAPCLSLSVSLSLWAFQFSLLLSAPLRLLSDFSWTFLGIFSDFFRALLLPLSDKRLLPNVPCSLRALNKFFFFSLASTLSLLSLLHSRCSLSLSFFLSSLYSSLMASKTVPILVSAAKSSFLRL